MPLLNWSDYDPNGFYDELFEARGKARPSAQALVDYLAGMNREELADRRVAADLAIKSMGITFTVYTQGSMLDRTWPFDILPRIIDSREWARTQAGLKQRVQALNLFIQDIYNDKKIIKDGVFPVELLEQSVNYRPQCEGMRPKHGVWAHILSLIHI